MKYLFSLLLFTACAGPSNGLMVQFDSTKPLDEAKLERHCDMDDSTACFLANQKLDQPLERLPVIQGVAASGRAIFTVLLRADQTAKWFLLERQPLALEPIASTRTHERPGSTFRLEQFEVAGLEPGKDHEMIAVDKNGMILDQRVFRTLRTGEDVKENRLRFALVSCSDDAYQGEQEGQWRSLLGRDPELIFAIGDNVYATSRAGQALGDMINPATLWERHAETRSNLYVFRSPKLVPVFAVWDDHDFGMNDGNETNAHREESRKIMEAFFPSIADAKSVLEGPGVSRALKVGRQAFILFDDRSFRSPNGRPPACRDSRSPLCKNKRAVNTRDATHFGRVQEEWAMSLAAKHEGPIWLMSGDQWFGGYHPFESYEGNHPESFGAFLKKLASNTRRNKNAYVFASGDRHLTEIMKVKPQPGYETFEFTSSGIHAKVFPGSWKDFPNRRQLDGASGTLNFMIIDSASTANNRLEIEARAIGPGDQVLFERKVKVSGSR